MYFKVRNATMHFLSIKRTSVLLIFLFYLSNSVAQTNRLDSLRTRLLQTTDKTLKKELTIKICEQFFSLSADNLLKYVELGKSLSAPGSEDYLIMQSYYCIYLFKKARVQEGLALSDSLLIKAEQSETSDKVRILLLSAYCGGLIRNNQSKEAIEQGFKLLETAEKLKDSVSALRAYVFLGWANMEIEQYADAVKWLNKGFHYSTNEHILEKGGGLYSNNASCYNNLNKKDSAFYFIALALKYNRKSENLSSLANSLNIRAAMYIKENNFSGAEADMKEAIHIREKLSDTLYIISDMAQLSSFYASINQPAKGIEVGNHGIEIAKKINNLPKLIFLYNSLAENYNKAGDKDSYAAALLSILHLKDSLYKQNSGDAIAEMEVKYELQKKENTIIKQEYEIARTKYTAIGFSIIFLLVLIAIWTLYRNYRLRQKRKMDTALAEQKLLAGKEVEVAKEGERKRIAADLHDNLGSYAAAITANVKMLKDESQNADNILSQLDDNAQSMVTQLGDTIWVLKNERLPITKLADRFKLWMLRLMQNYPSIKYNYSENIVDDIEFTPSKILHIFLILKECINNSIKHSDCTALSVSFFSEAHWVISIEDNGKGFVMDHIVKGSGINNIRNRAAECGWNVEWESIKTGGTRVIVSQVLLQNKYS